MYKYRSKQISFTDFNTPIGMKLNPNNRWIKKAEMIQNGNCSAVITYKYNSNASFEYSLQ